MRHPSTTMTGTLARTCGCNLSPSLSQTTIERVLFSDAMNE
jgi:hypothetical protein